jgi:hypothetical protein
MQREELTDSLASNLFWINLGIGTILTLAFAGSGRLLALFYHNSDVVQVTEGMSLTIVIGCLGYIHSGVVAARHAFQEYSNYLFRWAGAPSDCLDRFGAGGLALLGAGLGQCTQTAVVTAGVWLMCRWIPSRPGRAVGHRFRVEVRDKRLFTFCVQLRDSQHG